MLRAAVNLLTGLLAAVLALELLLRLLPVSTATMTGYYVDADILTYPPGHEWTVSTGWDLRNVQRLRANNWGFANERDFTPDPAAIALIGDSYVEASMLAAQDRPAGQLQMLLDGRRHVYGLGSPGTALLDYAHRVRFAAETLQVRDFVIWLEQGDARQSLCGSGNVHSRCLDPRTLQPRIERLPEPSMIKRLVRHSALAQYVASQLKFRTDAFLAALLARNSPAEPGGATAPSVRTPPAPRPEAVRQARRVIDAAMEQFFAQSGPYLKGRTLFIVDGVRQGPPAPASDGLFERRYLIESLRARGFEVVDLEPVYASHAAHSPLSLEVGPYDRHLNGLGVRLVMGQAAAWFAP